MKKYCAVWLLFMIMYPFIECTEEVVDTRAEKLISTFQIVRFPNDVCIGTNSRNGTCYTSAECSDKGGTSSGSCADGFGVCCVFLVQSCGSSSSENLTYWKKPTTFSDGMCDLTVCPTNDDICAAGLYIIYHNWPQYSYRTSIPKKTGNTFWQYGRRRWE